MIRPRTSGPPRPRSSTAGVVWCSARKSIRRRTLVVPGTGLSKWLEFVLHDAGRAKGLAVLDAPVSGGVMGAEAGTLTFMVGGAATDLERARPVLECMSRRIFHTGEPGSGQIAKICNNMMAACGMIVTAEAFALAQRFAMPAETLREIVSVSTGSCFSLTNYPPVPGLLPNVPSTTASGASRCPQHIRSKMVCYR